MTLPAELTPECLAEFSSRGPRYTSYPPATEFATSMLRERSASSAQVRAEGAPVSLYVHVLRSVAACVGNSRL